MYSLTFIKGVLDMQKHYGLTEIELEIMEFLWKSQKGITFKEIMNYINNDLEKGWKRQTLSTYLKNLQLLGFIYADTSKKNFVYFPTQTKEQYIQTWTRDLVEKQYENSITKFMSAFTGTKGLSKEEAEELRKLLF